MAFAHDGYFGEEHYKVADTARLLNNAMRWAASGKLNPRVGLIDGHALQSLFERQGARVSRITLDQKFESYDVLVLTPFQLTSEQSQRVRSRVESGGGLLAAATGWGWQQGSKKAMTEFSGNLLLEGSGLAWTDGFAGKTGPSGYRAGGEVSPFVNAATAIELIAAGRATGPKDFASALEGIRLTLGVIPHSEPQVPRETKRILSEFRNVDLVPSKRHPVRIDDPPRRFAVGLATVLAQDAPADGASALAAATVFPGRGPSSPREASTRSRSIPPYPAGIASGSTRLRVRRSR